MTDKQALIDAWKEGYARGLNDPIPDGEWSYGEYHAAAESFADAYAATLRQDEFAKVASSSHCPACGSSGPCDDAKVCGAATLKAAQGGVTGAMVDGPALLQIARNVGLREVMFNVSAERATPLLQAFFAATLEAALSAEPAAQGDAVALNVRHPKCHEAANAFWNYWNANGETHKRGYYESTWGAINAALRMVGVRPHDYGDAPPPDGSSPRYDDAAPPAQPAERVPEGSSSLEPDYYVLCIDGQYRLADPQPTVRRHD